MSYRRSPARWIAPLAILVALATIFALVNASTGGDSEDAPQATEEQERRTTTGRKTSTDRSNTTTSTTPKPARKTYRVKPGDTLASIAQANGVTVEELQELNPDVDSNSLSIGQEIRLAR